MGDAHMYRTFRNRALAWLIETQPRLFLRLKGLAAHPMADDAEFLRLHAGLLRDGEGIQLLLERHNLWKHARLVAGRPGAFAEVGVYRGGSAKILCEVKRSARLHLFDTFGGMPAVNPATDGDFHAGDFGDGSLADVQAYLASYPGVIFHPGFFPTTAAGVAEQDPVFQFVHLDVDLYQSTLDGLRFFYPLLAPGGRLISHDYGAASVPGVRRAFDEFMRDKPEQLVVLTGTQVLLEKI